MSKNLNQFALAVAIGFAAIASPLIAEDTKPTQAGYVADVGSQERINFSGKLRMLSQRIPSAACHLAEGVDPEGAAKLLAGAATEFDKILNALEFGDAELNVNGAEERRKTLVQIHDLRDKWAPMQAAANAMASGDVSEDNLNVILSQNMTVLGSAKLLVSELVAQYSDPFAMVQADSLLIDIAGRQRMLTQKMSKESCMLVSHHAEPNTADALTGTMSMFETSLYALTNGMPEAGIRRPPTAGISEGLKQVALEWNEAKPALEAILSGMEVNAEVETGKFKALNATMKKMNEVVGMYAKATKNDT